MRKTLIAAGVLTLIGPNICHAQTRPISKVEHALITDSYGRVLKDAASAQYRMQPIPLADNQKDGTTIYCFEVNAKNSYGGYAGYKAVWVSKCIREWERSSLCNRDIKLATSPGSAGLSPLKASKSLAQERSAGRYRARLSRPLPEMGILLRLN